MKRLSLGQSVWRSFGAPGMSLSNLAPIRASSPFAPWGVRYDPFGLDATETAGPSLKLLVEFPARATI